MTVVQLDSYRSKPRPAPRQRSRSQYKRYPLPFFNADTLNTWAVQASGDYEADIVTGRHYAIEFLKTADGTVGWTSLLPAIVADMIRAGPSGTWGDGSPKVNGVVVGFMGVISKAVTVLCMVTPMPDIVALMMEER